jgi:predicted nucleotidyltransferase
MGLLKLVRHEKEMRRLFGQQELRIIEKQLLGVNLKPSERTRLSRDIRPKFDIITRLSKFEKEFPLKKSQEIKYLLEKAMEEILIPKHKKDIEKIWVFGSYVQNKMRLNSDVDIAIKLKDISKKEATKLRIKLQAKLPEKIQIQIFNILPEKLKEEILKEGRVIYSDGTN